MISRYSWTASERVSIGVPEYRCPASGDHEQLAVALLHREGVHVLGRRQGQHRPGAQVEAGAVTGADDLEAFAIALAERSVVVAAAVLDRVEPAVDPVDPDEQRPRLDDLDPALRDLVRGAYPEFHVRSGSSGGASPSATLSSCTESSAHLRRIGVSGMPSSSSTSSLPSSRTSATGLPLATSEIIDAAACEIAQPRPLKRRSVTIPSSIWSSTCSSSPQSGLTPS